MADEKRATILGWLPQSGCPIGAQDLFDRAEQVGIGRPTVIRHLRQGERDFLVLRETNGRRVTYRWAPGGMIPDRRIWWGHGPPRILSKKAVPIDYQEYLSWYVRDGIDNQIPELLRLLCLSMTTIERKEAAANYCRWVLEQVFQPWIVRLTLAAWTHHDKHELFEDLFPPKPSSRQRRSR